MKKKRLSATAAILCAMLFCFSCGTVGQSDSSGGTSSEPGGNHAVLADNPLWEDRVKLLQFD